MSPFELRDGQKPLLVIYLTEKKDVVMPLKCIEIAVLFYSINYRDFFFFEEENHVLSLNNIAYH